MREWFKAMGLKLRTMLDPGVLLDKLREAADVRPRGPKDYYTVFLWLISKKLAVLLAVMLGLFGIAALVILIPSGFLQADKAGTVRTYSYRALPLRFYKGEVRILGKGGYTAYEGAVEKGEAKGTGRLYDKDSRLVYEGEFENSRYNGNGSLFYQNGSLSFQGAFRDNVPQGEGTAYREDGSKEYEGNFADGGKNGKGILFDAASNQIYQGEFINGLPRFQEFLGKTTTEAGEQYTGAKFTYLAEKELCVWMKEIGGIYRAASAEDTLEGEWIIDQILVLKEEFPSVGRVLKTKEDLLLYFGEASYEGTAYYTLPELAAGECSLKAAGSWTGDGWIQGKTVFTDVFGVDSIRRREGDILVFTRDGLVYTFYLKEGGDGFLFYGVEAMR